MRVKAVAIALLCVAFVFVAATAIALRPVERTLRAISSDAQTVRIADRNGQPLTASYQDRWNAYDYIPLYEVPELLREAFVFSEDRRFFVHGGVDWRARGAAFVQNVRHLRAVRGASTLTEQVARMINPRPRSLWSKWLEGIEAGLLERTASKADILEFYLNQVPYASNRRGIVQAARHYFDRDPDTLSTKEMLALAVLVRAPSGYDLYANPERIGKPLQALATQMRDAGLIDTQVFAEINEGNLAPVPARLPVDARHFARHVRMTQPQARPGGVLHTTLDAGLQAQVQGILDRRLRTLAAKNVHSAAAVVADYRTGEILAWASAGPEKTAEIDAALAPRQPGSAMKPFVYALALEKGWTAATLIDDAPLAEAVGSGLHRFRNYGGMYYGPVTLREALGNSLNIPALKAIQHAGTTDYLNSLIALGFATLDRHADVYDEGLALGNGEVTLREMVGAYAALANRGVYRPLRVLREADAPAAARRVYSAETASLISDILSDPSARRMEFGADSILNYPVQTAAKTGTSTDYRDAWTMAYDDRHVIGVWMGNLDYAPMNGVTGSTGPALAVRSIFSVLNRGREGAGLYMSPRLSSRDVCVRPARADGSCPTRTEWFAPGSNAPEVAKAEEDVPVIVRPTAGLQIAWDPRIPQDNQRFRFEVAGLDDGATVEWTLNDEDMGGDGSGRYLWPVRRGVYRLAADIVDARGAHRALQPVEFMVK